LALFSNDSAKYLPIRATVLATARSLSASLGADGVGGARRDSSVFTIMVRGYGDGMNERES